MDRDRLHTVLGIVAFLLAILFLTLAIVAGTSGTVLGILAAIPLGIVGVFAVFEFLLAWEFI